MIYAVSKTEMASGCKSENHKDLGATVDSCLSPNPRGETGVNELIDKMLKSKPAILTVGDNLDFSWVKENLNKNPINNLEKHHPNVIINNRDGDNMSAMLMYYDKNEGAIIVTDSRETSGESVSDDRIKVYQNENIIIGQIGLNSTVIDDVRVELSQMVVDSLLAGNSIDVAINQTYNDKKIFEYLNDNNFVIFYAKKNGELGVYDIRKDGALENKINSSFNSNIYHNMPNALITVYDGLLNNVFVSNYEGFEFKEAQLRSIMKMLITIEQEREKLHLGTSTIGGPVQCAVIKFNK